MNRATILLIILANFLVFLHGLEFLCEFNNVNWATPVGSVYTCYNAQVSVKNNSTSLESIEGVHHTGESNDDVKALYVRYDATEMQHLPKNIDKFFPNLKVLFWQYGNLTSITADDLRTFPELKFLSLLANKIVSLDADLFQHTPGLQTISIWNNKITNVGYDLLENLNELTFANFNNNPCINFRTETPQEILELKEKLRTQCPPLATTTQSTSTSTTTISTTTEESCNVRCTLNGEVDELMKNLTDQRSEIEVLKNENAEQRRFNDKQSQVINELQRTIINQNVLNAKNEERMLELEQQMKDFLSKPWFFVYKRTLSNKHHLKTKKHQSIINTKRAFETIKLMNFRSPDGHAIERCRESFISFSTSIKKLEISSAVICERDIINLLNHLPSLENISFYDIEFHNCDEIINERLNLQNLKHFRFHLCNKLIPEILLRLSYRTLQSLAIDHTILKHEILGQIFEQQGNIAELEFDPYYVEPTSLEHLRLQKLKLSSNRHIANLVKNQKNLQSLDLSKIRVNDNEFLEICNLQNLISLKLRIDLVSWEILENLNKLQTLNELHLDYGLLEVEYMRNVSRIRMANLQRLKILLPRLKITSTSFAEMALNMTNIKHLHISYLSVGVIGSLVENFKNLETLVIGCDYDSSEVIDFPIKGIRHEKLKDVCIYRTHTTQMTLKCTKTIVNILNTSVRNLERLKFRNVVSLTCEQFCDIFSNHENLTHFLIDNPFGNVNPFDETFVRVLKINGKRLKYFQSRGAEIAIHKKTLEKEFQKHFGTICIKPLKKQIILRSCTWEHADD